MKPVKYKAGMFLALAVAILIVAAVYLLAADRARDNIHAAGARPESGAERTVAIARLARQRA